MINTQTTAQILAADLQASEAALQDLRDKRAATLAEIVAGTQPPSALDDLDKEIASALEEAARRHEIAHAARQEAEKQRIAAERSAAIAEANQALQAYRDLLPKMDSAFQKVTKTIESVHGDLNALNDLTKQAYGAGMHANSLVDALHKKYGEDSDGIPSRVRARNGHMYSGLQVALVGQGSVYAGVPQKVLTLNDLPR